jgi:hypothetical protein
MFILSRVDHCSNTRSFFGAAFSRRTRLRRGSRNQSLDSSFAAETKERNTIEATF